MTGAAPSALAVAVIELTDAAAARACAAALSAEAEAAGLPLRIEGRAGPADPVPQRRRRAALAAGADGAQAVLLVEDTTRLAPGWAAALRVAFDDPQLAAAWGPVAVDPALPPRFRALGRLEYGRFDGSRPGSGPPGNALALRLDDLRRALPEGAGVIEHDLAGRLERMGRTLRLVPALAPVYAGADPHGAALATRFGHGRIYGAGRGGGRAVGVLKALLAGPVLSLRALRAARMAGPARQWLAELPWILAMAGAWSAGELTGQILGPGDSERSWT